MVNILETDRLLMREFVIGDLEVFYKLVSDPDVIRYTGDGAQSLEAARIGLQERIFQDYQNYGFGRWAVLYKPTGKIIGFAGLKYLTDVGEVDLGYRFFKKYWGMGLASEASKAIVHYGFDYLQLRKIIGISHLENKASIRVLEKAGFKFEKHLVYGNDEVAWHVIEK